MVSPQRLLALALLIFALKKLKLSEPPIHSVRDFRSTGVVLVMTGTFASRASKYACLRF